MGFRPSLDESNRQLAVGGKAASDIYSLCPRNGVSMPLQLRGRQETDSFTRLLCNAIE
jgi:hypothetical protein